MVIEPRKLWVSGLAGRKGKIAGLAPGRALAFADDPAWGDVLRVLWQRDAPAPPEVLDGLVQVLVRWSASWERPVAVVAMPSRRFPLLVGSLAEQVARVGRLPLVDALGGERAAADGRGRLGGPGAGPAGPHQRARRGELRRAGAAGGRHGTDAVDGHGCVGAAGRGRREPGDAARRPPAPLSAQELQLARRIVGAARHLAPSTSVNGPLREGPRRVELFYPEAGQQVGRNRHGGRAPAVASIGM